MTFEMRSVVAEVMSPTSAQSRLVEVGHDTIEGSSKLRCPSSRLDDALLMIRR